MVATLCTKCELRWVVCHNRCYQTYLKNIQKVCAWSQWHSIWRHWQTEKHLNQIWKYYIPNITIQNSAIPEGWLYSYLVPLPKHGKDISQINGNWITAIEDTIGKLLEKIITRIWTRKASHSDLETIVGIHNAAVFVYDMYEGFHAGFETCAAAMDLYRCIQQSSTLLSIVSVTEAQHPHSPY